MRVAGLTREQWGKTRAAGRTRYLLLWGVLGRGLPMTVLLTVLFLVLEGRRLELALLGDASLWLRSLFAAALFSVGGVASAYARWRSMELRFDAEGDGDAPRPPRRRP